MPGYLVTARTPDRRGLNFRDSTAQCTRLGRTKAIGLAKQERKTGFSAANLRSRRDGRDIRPGWIHQGGGDVDGIPARRMASSVTYLDLGLGDILGLKSALASGPVSDGRVGLSCLPYC